MPKYLYHDPKAGGYYSRVIIPVDIRHLFEGKTEFKKRWPTGAWRSIEPDHLDFIAEKKREISAARAHVNASKNESLSGPTARRIKRLEALQSQMAPLAALTSTQDIRNIITLWFQKRLRNEEDVDMRLISRYGLGSPRVHDEAESTEIDAATLKFNGRNDSIIAPQLQHVTDHILTEAGYYLSTTDRSGELYGEAVTLTHHALIELLALRYERLGGPKQDRTSYGLFYEQPQNQPAKLLQPSNAAGDPRRTTWAGLIEQFLSSRGRMVYEKTLRSYQSAIDLGNEIFGLDTPVSEITPDMCFDWRDTFLKVPANARKIFKGKTLLEAADIAVRDGLPPRKQNTLRTQIKNLKAIFNYAIDEGIITKNPARKLVAEQERAFSGDRVYSVANLNAIFSSPPYLAFSKDKLGHPKKEDLWVALIALFSGARQQEICQLLTTDIKDEDGIHYVEFSEDHATGKKLKTSSSHRRVPLHPTLVAVGFMDFVEMQKVQGQKWLFPTIQDRKNPSDAFSKRYSHFLKSYAGKRQGDGMCFHSFRHTFTHWAYKAAGAQLDRNKIKVMLGWQQNEMIDAQYGGQYSIHVLYEELGKLAYPGLNLDHLIQT